MTTITVTIDAEKLGTLLAKVAEALNPEEILDEATALLLNRIRTRFLAEQDTQGNRWPESEAAKKRRAGGYTYRNGKKYTGTGTLFESGKLFHSIQAAATGVNEREIKTDVEYGIFHQYGTGRLPKREFLGASDYDLALMDKLVMRRIKRMVAT